MVNYYFIFDFFVVNKRALLVTLFNFLTVKN